MHIFLFAMLEIDGRQHRPMGAVAMSVSLIQHLKAETTCCESHLIPASSCAIELTYSQNICVAYSWHTHLRDPAIGSHSQRQDRYYEMSLWESGTIIR